MINLFLLTALSLSSDFTVDNLKQQPLSKVLSEAAQGELKIVDRLKSLRLAAEKLPQNWVVKGIKSIPADRQITRKSLLREVRRLELSAAERWAIIVENTALLGKMDNEFSAQEKRILAELYRLPHLHININHRMDQFNARMKEGILLNMASSIVDQD